MHKLISLIKRTISSQNNYFVEYKNNIAAHNLMLIRTLCIAGIVVFLLYYTITELFFNKWAISLLYGLSVPILACFLCWSVAEGKKNTDAKKIGFMTFLLYVLTLAYLIVLSVFAHKEIPSVYYTLFLLMAPVIFILPARVHIISTFTSLCVFAILVLCFKSPAVWNHELFEACTSAVFAVIVIIFMTQFRIQTDRSTEEYYNLSRTDALTGLYNKTAGLAAAEAYMTSHPGDICAGLFIDMDNFKYVNDNLGHMEGDKVLRDIGGVLKSAFRGSDILCRFGGDEFFVLMKDVRSDDAVTGKASDIIAALRECSTDVYTSGCSIGIFIGRAGSYTIDDFTSNSDSALYAAKNGGKNTYRVF